MADLEGLLPAAEEVIFLFLEYPQAGKSREELVARLGAEGAAGVARKMIEQVVEVVREFERPGLAKIAYFAPETAEGEFKRWLGNGFHYLAQPDGDSGRRLEDAFVGAFRKRAKRVLALSTDCAEVSSEILGEAFEALLEIDTAIGPSLSGGYYLMGLNRPCHSVFRGIPWCTDRTLRETLARLRGCGLNVRLLPPLLDWGQV